MVTTHLLERMKARVALFLDDTCTIEAEVDAVDEMGAPAHTWEVVEADVECRVIDARQSGISATMEVGAQEAMVDTYRLIVPVGTALAVDQRVTVNSDVYQIVALVDGRSDAVDAQAVITRVR